MPEQAYLTAVIFDVVSSRGVPSSERTRLQDRIEDVLTQWNNKHRDSLVSQFLITLGDEVQGLIADPSIIPDILWSTEWALPRTRFRWGFGFGTLSTELRPYALGMDGPALHNARRAIEEARKGNRGDGVFCGFKDYDQSLNGFARLSGFMRRQLTDIQREIVDLSREGVPSTQIAELRGIKPSTVSLHKKASGLTAILEGEAGFRNLLRIFDTRASWSNKVQQQKWRKL